MRQSDPPVRYLVGHLQRAPDPVGEASPRPALAGRPVRVSRSNCWPRTASSAVLAQSADPGPQGEGACAGASWKWLWQRLNRLAAMQIHARATADEAGCGPRQGTDRLAPDRHHRRPGLGQLLPPRSSRPGLRQIPATRRALSATPQSHRRRPHDSLAILHPACRRRRSLQKLLKGDLAIRPIFHHEERRIEAHIFIAFLAYCSYITLQRRLHAPAHAGLSAQRSSRGLPPSR